MITNNETQVQFKLCTSKSKLGKPAAGDIVFIQDTHELYLDGIYYGLSTTDAQTLATAVSNIATLRSNVGDYTDITKSLVQIVTALRSFADGDILNANGPSFTTYADGHVLHNVTNVKDAIEALAIAVNSLNAKSWTEVNKPVDAGQFATAVTQETDGQIAVTYGDAYSADIKRTSEQQSSITGATVEAALETLKGAAAAANTNADSRIAKSPTDTTAKTISGVTGSSLIDAAAIATAIETACDRLLKDSTNQAQTNWDVNEKKTLTTLRDLIKGLQDTVDTITTDDLATIQSSITAIKNELGGEEGGTTRNLVGSFLDAIATILPTKNNDNTYTFNIGTGTGATTATTIQGVIDDLVGRITTAAAAGVTKITNGDGITVTNNGVGNVTVNANSGAKLTAALTTVANGATTAQGATIQTALNDINAKAAQGIGDAATAQGAAEAAQADATAALTQLKWTVIS